MIALIDYDMGNLRSVAKAFERVGADVSVTRDPKAIRDASRIVLPGVGAFRDCMKNLSAFGLIEPVIRAVEAGKPFLGICLGLQLLFDESSEFGAHKGLGLIKGKVVRFPSEDANWDRSLKIPHMGWNGIRIEKTSPLLSGVTSGSFFYFVHSYYAVPDDPDVALSTTDYGLKFTSAVAKDNIVACQFHPEKSQSIGLKILKNFSMMN